ncbi:type III-B CRISPR module-associated protein Cmr5 [Streptomyces sp. NPDC003393]
MTSLRRVEQAMARDAGAMLPETINGRLRTRYRQLPVMLHSAGLAATYAFILSNKGEKELGKAYAKVAEGIRKHIGDRQLIGGKNRWATDLELLDALGHADRTEYMRASAEIMALAGWLNRLAEAHFRATEAENGSPEKASDRTGAAQQAAP